MRITGATGKISDELIITIGSMVAAALVVTMVALAIVGGVSQETFQVTRSASDFASLLGQGAESIRLQYAVDDMFIITYSLVFIAVARWCAHRGSALFAYIAMAAILLSAVLDLLENYNVVAMLQGVEQDLVLSSAQIQLSVIVTQIKFHLGAMALVLLSLVLPWETLIERSLGFSLLVLQMPLGIAAGIYPNVIVSLARSVFFIVGFIMLAWVFWRRHQSQGASRKL